MEKSEAVARLTKTVVNSALQFAKDKGIISENIATEINLPKGVKSKPYRIRNINSASTLSLEQSKALIKASENTPIHLQVMFALLMGMRLSEINGLKFSDIDYVSRKLKINRQIGRNLKKNKEECKLKTYTKQEIGLKTKSSYRTLDIPDLLFDAILEQKTIYEKNKRRRINDITTPFSDDDYICCSTYGMSRSRGFHQKYFKKLLKDNNLPNIRFHDLRHTYGTILLKANFDAKAVSKMLGHASEIITVDVYCDTNEIIYDCLDIIEPYINEVTNDNNKNENNEIKDYCEDLQIEDINKYFDNLLSA